MVLLKTQVSHWVKKKAEIFEVVEGNNASKKRKRMKTATYEEPIEVEDDEEDGDDTIKDKCLEKPTSIKLRSAIETLLDFSFFIESDDVQRCTMEISKLIERELS